ncbi:MAG: type I restriction enzyme HsdR N-terminal domain-containing protein [Pseudomonadota bacterium]
MGGHHLILGRLKDYLTGRIVDDTLDERIRQKLARLLVEVKGFSPADIVSRTAYTVHCGPNRAVIPIDFIIYQNGRAAMLVKYGPGSLVTRHQPVLAAARIVTERPIPVAVATNGRDADVLSTHRGTVLAGGMTGIPDRRRLESMAGDENFPLLSVGAIEKNSRILYAYEVDGACPCDDTVCKL